MRERTRERKREREREREREVRPNNNIGFKRERERRKRLGKKFKRTNIIIGFTLGIDDHRIFQNLVVSIREPVRDIEYSMN
jgi:hypothetical protein